MSQNWAPNAPTFDERRCGFLLSEARAYLAAKAPYYSSIIYNFVTHWELNFPKTLGVTKGMVLIIHPEFWLGLPSVKMRASCLVHEAHHILRGYERIEALGAIDRELANIAADIPINDDMLTALDKNGKDPLWDLPSFAVTSLKFGFKSGLTMEQYFELLMQKEKNGGGRSEHGEGEPYELDNVPIQNGIFSGGCGEIAGNSSDASLEEKLDAEMGRSFEDVEEIRAEGIRELQQAVVTGRGRMPGNLQDLLNWEEKDSPIISWEQILRHTVRRAVGRLQAGQQDYSLKRPSKRSYMRGYLLPGLVKREVIPGIVEDSSASMGAEQLKVARIEACSVFTQLSIQRAWFMDADASVASVQYVNVQQLRELPITGRGGTDFRPAIAAAKELRPRPQVLIYFTDGDGYAPAEAPTEFPVIWCVVPSPHRRLPAPWGTTIVMSNDRSVRRDYDVI